jgi:DNA-binding SARP family transcriptional activator/Tfp pilus assembly protein PilF
MEFRILGSFEADADGVMLPLGGPQLRTVLAVLLLEPGRTIPVSRLVDAVWPDDPPQTAAKQVRNTISRLRTILDSHGSPDVIAADGGGYRLEIPPGAVDAARFDALTTVARAAACAGGTAEAADALRAALALWRGPLLAGMTGPVIEAAATAWDERRRAAQDIYYQHMLALGQHREIVPELTALLGQDRLRENAAAQLMLALYRSGRQPDALKTYQAIRGRLDAELGLDPGPELQCLHQQILTRDTELDLRPGTDPVGTPEPSAASAAAVIPRQLPATARHFAGRAGELKQLDDLLSQAAGADAPAGGGGMPGTVVITAIGGTAGIGKTALAVQWAHQVAERFPDGQLYVNLRGYDPAQPMPPADALAGFLRALGVAGQDIPPEEDERAARYRSLLAGRRMLVILDNAREAEQVRPLLAGTPPCAVVVTSRDSLAGLVARDGAARLDLDLLPPEEAVALLRALIGARVDADPGAAATLAERCCRLPLALRVTAELAAARPDVRLAELAGELADQQRRLDLLEAGGDRRTAVRAVFSWSYRHLDSGAARAFRLAGLHPGPDLDTYAAAALTGSTAERAGGGLDVLARAHLIQPAGPGRYGMHDLLRAYARGLAAAQDSEGERLKALTRLFDHYLHTAAAAMDTLFPAERHRRPGIPPPVTPAPPVTEGAAARAWLDAERASLTAVVAYTAGHGWHGHATRLAATLFRYLYNGGHCPEAIIIHDHARRAARHTGDGAAEAAALTNLGAVDLQQGRHQQAAGNLQQALALCREIGDRGGEARTLGDLGVVDRRQGRCDQADGHHRQALALFREFGDRGGEAEALNGLGEVFLAAGQPDQARIQHATALDVASQVGAKYEQARAHQGLGSVRHDNGDPGQASHHWREALTLYTDLGAPEADQLRAQLTTAGNHGYHVP